MSRYSCLPHILLGGRACTARAWASHMQEGRMIEVSCLSKVQCAHASVILLQRRGARVKQHCNCGSMAAAHCCHEGCAACAGMRGMLTCGDESCITNIMPA